MKITLTNFVKTKLYPKIVKPFSKTIWIVLFALAMGYLESAVVVYLRELYYPGGFDFPLKEMNRTLAVTELYREAATLIMILALSVLVAEKRLHRFAWFLVVFSVWDIAYYIFLKILLDWPLSFLTTDILFLLPSIWTGPVIAPVINSLTMLLLAVVILNVKKGFKPIIRLSNLVWTLLIVGSFVVLFAYMKDFTTYALEYKQLNPTTAFSLETDMRIISTKFIPRSFDWLLFIAGVAMHFTAIFLVVFQKIKIQKNSQN
jgi:hypothetical protein